MKIFTSIILCLFINSLFAQERVGNGEGLSEQRVTTINEYLPFYIALCVQGGCMMDRAELNRARALLVARKENPQFIFVSGAKNPGTFEVTGLQSLIQTTRESSSVVKINTDKLYTDHQAITLDEALMIVVAAYDYKLNLVSNEIFINKLAFAFSQAITTVQHSFDYPYIRYSLYLSNVLYNRTLIINDGIFSFNLSRELFQFFKCAGPDGLAIKKAYWVEADKNFSLAVVASINCSVVGEYTSVVAFNLKSRGSSFPGNVPKLELDQEHTVISINPLR
jgi:hypothetical protein